MFLGVLPNFSNIESYFVAVVVAGGKAECERKTLMMVWVFVTIFYLVLDSLEDIFEAARNQAVASDVVITNPIPASSSFHSMLLSSHGFPTEHVHATGSIRPEWLGVRSVPKSSEKGDPNMHKWLEVLPKIASDGWHFSTRAFAFSSFPFSLRNLHLITAKFNRIPKALGTRPL